MRRPGSGGAADHLSGVRTDASPVRRAEQPLGLPRLYPQANGRHSVSRWTNVCGEPMVTVRADVFDGLVAAVEDATTGERFLNTEKPPPPEGSEGE